MSTAVCLFGYYPNLPEAIRKAGRQATYGGGHAIYVQRADAPYKPPFLDEFTGETGKVTDCVPASGVRGVNFMTSGAKAPCTPAEREGLQTAMGTTNKGADESQLVAGVKKRYGLSVAQGRSWAAIVSALGGEDTQVIVGDPLGRRDLTARLGDLQRYSAGMASRYVLFPTPVELPDTSEDSVLYIREITYPARRDIRAVPPFEGSNVKAIRAYRPPSHELAIPEPLVPTKPTHFWASGEAHVTGWSKDPNEVYHYFVADPDPKWGGVLAGLFVPWSDLLQPAPVPTPVADCSDAVEAAIAPLSAEITALNTRIANARKALG